MTPGPPPILVEQRPVLAVCLILCGSALVAMTALLAKALGSDALGPPLHPLQVAHGRFVFAFMGLLLACAVIRPTFVKPAWGLQIARATGAFLAVLLLFTAAQMIPLSDATAISFLSPIVTMILAGLFLGERVGRARWLAAMVGLAGAIVLLRPGEGALALGALAALGAALFMGAEVTIMKRLTLREPPVQILLLTNFFGTLIASAAVVPVFQTPTGPQLAALIALGLIMLSAQVLWVNAMRLADASYVIPVAYTTLVFAALYDLLIFAVWPDAVSVAGAALILSGAALLTMAERRRPPSP
ncbi:MAG: DMT family transporter [Pseudomonadota bacterium]